MAKEGAGLGIFSGFLASLCCIGPTIAILLGLGPILGITGGCFAQYRPYFALIGIIAFSSGIYLWIKRKEGTCSIEAVKKNKRNVVMALSVMLITYAFLMFFVLPELQSEFIQSSHCSLSFH